MTTNRGHYVISLAGKSRPRSVHGSSSPRICSWIKAERQQLLTVNPAGSARSFGKRLKDTSRATFMRFLWGAEADAGDDNLSSSMRGGPLWLPQHCSCQQLLLNQHESHAEVLQIYTFFPYGLCIPSVFLQVHPLSSCFAQKNVLISNCNCTYAIEKT